MTSGGLWVVLLWIVIIGSRPVSFWFGEGFQAKTPDDYLEGSPIDRNLFFFLIVAGLVVLLRRRVDWGRLFASNGLFFAFFLYCGISVIWSDYSFVAFKRWIKDLGNVVMALVIVTEKYPAQATRAVLARYTYIAIPLSVLFIKYFPEFGRSYDRWTWEVEYCGIGEGRGGLGSIILICGLFLVWDLIEMRIAGGRDRDKTDLLSRAALVLMLFWLTGKANSSTALVCLILGAGLLLFMRLPLAKRQVKHLGTYSLVVAFLILLLYSVPDIREPFVRIVGRDTTLTGRTDLWAELLKEPVNPFLGTGYQSFWLGPRAEHYWKRYDFHPNQAHNGYLETYLNGGLVGVCLLIGMILSAGSNLKKELSQGDGYGILRFSILVVALFFSWTEAIFDFLSVLWMILLVAALNYPPSPKFMHDNMV